MLPLLLELMLLLRFIISNPLSIVGIRFRKQWNSEENYSVELIGFEFTAVCM